jgi:hypothetical protein
MMTFHVQPNLGKSAGKTKEACFTNVPGWRNAGRVLKTQFSDGKPND